jgi:hypothetical protein
LLRCSIGEPEVLPEGHSDKYRLERIKRTCEGLQTETLGGLARETLHKDHVSLSVFSHALDFVLLHVVTVRIGKDGSSLGCRLDLALQVPYLRVSRLRHMSVTYKIEMPKKKLRKDERVSDD